MHLYRNQLNKAYKAFFRDKNADQVFTCYHQALYAQPCETDTYCHAWVIVVAGKVGRIDLAEMAYRNAIILYQCDAAVHAAMISAAGNKRNGCAVLVKNAYFNAIRMWQMNEKFFETVHAAAHKNNWVDLIADAHYHHNLYRENIAASNNPKNIPSVVAVGFFYRHHPYSFSFSAVPEIPYEHHNQPAVR